MLENERTLVWTHLDELQITSMKAQDSMFEAYLLCSEIASPRDMENSQLTVPILHSCRSRNVFVGYHPKANT